MLITRRKRKENKAIAVYLNNKRLEQVQKIRYLGIITDSKINFRDQIIYTSQKCTKLIHALSRSAKMNWGLSSKALYTIYKGEILPLMTYGVPVWIKALEREHNRTIHNRVQRIINIKIAKAYRTSNEVLCALTGITPIVIKAEEEAKIFNIMRGSNQNEIDKDEKASDWLHPSELVRIIETTEEELQIYTDGSKKRKWCRRRNSYLCQRYNRGKTKVQTPRQLLKQSG
jgi:hypothetical protein